LIQLFWGENAFSDFFSEKTSVLRVKPVLEKTFGSRLHLPEIEVKEM
jgi:hypothetical protein